MTQIQIVIDGGDEPWASWLTSEAPLPRVGDYLRHEAHPARYRVREVEFTVRNGPGGRNGARSGPTRVRLYVERLD